jgi:hypothetical protein
VSARTPDALELTYLDAAAKLRHYLAELTATSVQAPS